MCMKPDFLNTLLKEPDGFSKYIKLFINYQGRKLFHAMLLFHRSLIFCHITLGTVRYLNKRSSVEKNHHRKRNSEGHISQNVNGMSLSIG